MHKSKLKKQMLNNSTSPAILPMQCYMPCLSHGSLFSGIGGFDLAAQWMGWTNVFQCEKDDWCRKVLAKNFPQTERFADIKEFYATKYNGAIDIISGGFPCQPFSTAGNRKGKEDDRYLWEEMLRVVREVEPTYVVGENVVGIIGLALDTVLSDLEAQGYTTETFIIPACAKNAWHRRDRVWIVAYAKGGDADRNARKFQGKNEQAERSERPEKWLSKFGSTGDVPADTNNARCNEQRQSITDGAELFAPKCSSWWEAEPGMGRVVDGLPNRVDRLKGLGNAIVPQVAYEIFSAIGTVARHGI